jgi:hypothetical protein
MSDRTNDALDSIPANTSAITSGSAESIESRIEWAPEPAPESGPQAAGDPTPHNIHDFPLRVPSLTNSPGCTPAFPRTRSAAPLRRVRSVRVDAWAAPAATTWTRTRKTVRKVNRQSQSTNWALPF